MNLLGGELNASHMRFVAAGAPKAVPTGDLGAEVEPAPDGTAVVVTEVLPDSPAARVDAGLKAGDRITAVNGKPLAAGENFYARLADTVKQRVTLRVAGAAGERDVELRPGTLAQARELRYRAWVKERRALVEKWSGGKLGYIHIQGMDEPSLEDFERDLFAAADGKWGLIIDVRNNGGGWTTDYLMAILSVRRHAWTVPRGADPAVKAYPDAERLPLPAWTRPALALCDQDSYSNAEIFSWAFQSTRTRAGGGHAHLRRGDLHRRRPADRRLLRAAAGPRLVRGRLGGQRGEPRLRARRVVVAAARAGLRRRRRRPAGQGGGGAAGAPAGGQVAAAVVGRGNHEPHETTRKVQASSMEYRRATVYFASGTGNSFRAAGWLRDACAARGAESATSLMPAGPGSSVRTAPPESCWPTSPAATHRRTPISLPHLLPRHFHPGPRRRIQTRMNADPNGLTRIANQNDGLESV